MDPCHSPEPPSRRSELPEVSGRTLERGQGGTDEDPPLRLTSNENRMGLPQSIRDAVVEAFEDAHIYPDDSCAELTRALAERHRVAPDSIVHGHGSTELLRISVCVLAVEGSRFRLVMANPTFEQLVGYADPYGPELVEVPLLRDSWAHDVEGMKREVQQDQARALVYVCNPNNPTGTLTPVDQIREWIEEASPRHFFVVDEAYFEFVDDPSYETLARLAAERPNVIVLRTFSKIFSMAGIRVGYAVAHPETAARLKKFRSGRGPNHLGNRAALAALRDPAIVQRALKSTREARTVVYGVLDELGLEVMESHTNFVMHEVGGPVHRYVERMADAGFQVGRPFGALPTHNRLSLGTPDEMRGWADALRDFRRRRWV